nr:hypothetical protein [Pseudomonas aeruginosa]
MSRVFVSPLATPFHSLVSIFPIPSRYISIFRAPPPRYFSPSLILPAGSFVVPAEGARLDQYGNMSRGQMIQILSGLGALEYRAGFKGNATQSARSLAKGHQLAYFVMRRGRRPIGIAERRGRTLTMVLAFVRQPQYRVRFQFHEVVRRVAEDDARIEANIERALAKALR